LLAFLFDLEDGSDVLLRNAGRSPNYRVLQHGIPCCSCPCCENFRFKDMNIPFPSTKKLINSSSINQSNNRSDTEKMEKI
jgi:hypothetical protein